MSMEGDLRPSNDQIISFIESWINDYNKTLGKIGDDPVKTHILEIRIVLLNNMMNLLQDKWKQKVIQNEI